MSPTKGKSSSVGSVITAMEPESLGDIISCLKSDQFGIKSPQLTEEVTDQLLLEFKQLMEDNLPSDLSKEYSFDWEKLGECYAFIFDDYITNVELINQHICQCHEERSKWQTDCFKSDEELSIERINTSEQWICLKEVQLNQMKQHIRNTIDLIRGEVQKFQSLTSNE